MLKLLRHIAEIKEAYEKWVDGDNYARAVKWGRQLDRLKRYMPEQALQFPTNRLFRLIIVKQNVLDKVLRKEKPLILKNRKYSSWTTSARAAAKFTEKRYLSDDEAYVILQKTFTPDEMLVNIPELMRFLNKQGTGVDLYDYILDEQEVVVRNIKNDYKFGIENIGLWKTLETKWLRPSQWNQL